MDSIKSKSAKILRKLTSPQSKPFDLLADLSNHKAIIQGRKTAKHPLVRAARRTQSKSKGVAINKSYLLNKTALGSPFQKSAMLSYISTPNQKSFNVQKLKMIRGDLVGHSLKAKQQFQSTQDDNFGQQLIKVQLVMPDKKSICKYFPLTEHLNTLLIQFQPIIQQFCIKNKNNCYGMLGFQAIPFNFSLTQIINTKSSTFQQISNYGLKQITIVPNILKKSISYQSLQFSDFQVLKFLGSGGFSQVFLAKCRLDFQYTALKFIRKDTITTSKKIKMLQNQKNILFSVKHQNLIDLLYAFQTKNFIAFGLQYCPNGNLYSYLQRVKSLNQGQAKHILLQILSGLQYLHANNILFRDIKLQNLLFDNEGNIKITDFGLSKPDVDDDQITFSYCGSPQYMAPQMLTKSGHSYQVDFYALGILLYELLFGRSPFYAPKKQQIFHAILNSQPKFPKTPVVSKQVKGLIKGLLAKNPNHRIGSLKGIKQILSHPWFKVIQSQKIAIRQIVGHQIKSSGKRQFEQVKQLFQKQQADKKFTKAFFSQNFVNRQLCERTTKKIKKFQTQIKRQQKVQSKQIHIKANSKRK